MKGNVSWRLKARIFDAASSPANTVSQGTPAVRLDAHAQKCVACQAALDVPSPSAACVTRLCPEGLALLFAALSPVQTLAARDAVARVAS